MQITAAQLRAISKSKPPADNVNSVALALNKYGAQFGVDLPHRLAHVIAQVMHESGGLVFDREIWGPTEAQKRYDTGKKGADLGNTPAADGDGRRNAGRGPLQVTGGANLRAFTKWAQASFGSGTPDFFKTPDLLNTDPWEGLSILWYWDSGNPTGQSLNVYADANNIEMITRRVNGGLNGYDDRIDYYGRTALVLLGLPVGVKTIRTSVMDFQRKAQTAGLIPPDTDHSQVDGTIGPVTRSALHQTLAMLSGSEVTKAPVVQETKVEVAVPSPVPVAPRETTSPGRNYLALALAGVSGSVPVIGGFLVKFDPWVQLGFFALTIAALIWVFLNLRSIASNIRLAIELINQPDVTPTPRQVQAVADGKPAAVAAAQEATS